MNKGIFIAGTGFQVGKTYIGAGLAANLYNLGIKVGVIKPVVHDCLKCSGKPYSIQGEMLKLAAEITEVPELIYPYCLRNRDFSQILFTDDNETFSMDYLLDKYNELQNKYDYVIVAGVGGIAEQINSNTDMADLAEAIGLPIVLVANNNIETYNQLQLAIKYIKYKNLAIKGYILNQKKPEVICEEDDRRINLLEEQLEVPYLGFNPFVEGVNPVYGELGVLTEKFKKAIDISKLC